MPAISLAAWLRISALAVQKKGGKKKKVVNYLAAFRPRSNFKLIVSLRGKELEITFILKMLSLTPIKKPAVIDLVDFMCPRNLHNLLKMNDS